MGHAGANSSKAAVCPVSSTVPGTKHMLRKHLLNLFEEAMFLVINFFHYL